MLRAEVAIGGELGTVKFGDGGEAGDVLWGVATAEDGVLAEDVAEGGEVLCVKGLGEEREDVGDSGYGFSVGGCVGRGS